ncbi:sigma-70 family RNA polymerase sigma factor [Rapidithrix thailandica]|uniref:Sigma-70 family RNA polymerase sigma factor n=1 Tax=Rapidithrix thailandica TaxID=413964 RepID=A0AAW9S7I3_9BACT
MLTLSDAELWESFKSGNKEAYAHMYQQQIRPLLAYGLRICPLQDIVEDCIHDLFVDLWRRKAHLGTSDNIKFYLFKSLKRRLHTAMKHPGFSLEYFHKHPDNKVSAFEEELIQKEIVSGFAKNLQAAFQQLTPKQKEVIHLKFYDGLSYEEIAELLNINYQSVRNTIYRAMTELRKQLLLSCFFLLYVFM